MPIFEAVELKYLTDLLFSFWSEQEKLFGQAFGCSKMQMLVKIHNAFKNATILQNKKTNKKNKKQKINYFSKHGHFSRSFSILLYLICSLDKFPST